MSSATNDDFVFLRGAGEAASLIRATDWAATPVGPPALWPQSLRTLIGVMLGASQPMFLAWGGARTLLYNDSYAGVLARKHPSALGRPFLDVWSEIADDLLPMVERAYRGEPVHMDHITLMMERKGYREETHFSFSYTPVRGEGDAIEGFFCVLNEITEQVAATRRLRESEASLRGREAQFRTLAQAAPNMVWTAGADGHLDWFNQRTHVYSGLEPEDLAGAGWTRIIHPEDLPSVAAAWEHSLAASELYETEFRIRRADGDYRWHLVRAEVVKDDNGENRWIGTNTDIHDGKVASQALSAANETLELEVRQRTRERDRLWDNSQDIAVLIDKEGRFRGVNPATTTILGWTPGEMIGRTVFDFVVPDDVPSTGGALAKATEAALPSFINRYRHKGGGFRWISWVAAPEGEIIYATGRDVTAERESSEQLAAAQAALRQAQKMDAIGQLTGGIAHDFNNMLAVVIGSLDLLGRRLGEGDSRSRRYVENAMEGARRAATLTQRLLAFSRQQPLDPVAVDANKLVAGMSDLLRHTLSGNIRLESVIGGGLWRCHVDPNQLENAILNLAVNARDAMPEGGRLTIETQNAHLDERYAAGHVGLAPGQYVLVAVSDTGAGMGPEVIAKAFDPFFTTKEVGKGTGLGLSQVYGFVKQSGGHVKIYSEPEQGTTVKLYLPRFFGGGEAGFDAAAGMAGAGERLELVLVVEDDANVRQVTLDALQALGYRTLEADGAGEALRLLDAHPAVALLFTDIVMPDVDGRTLADEAVRRKPGLKVLFTTGYTRNAVVHNGVLDPGVHLLGKPFTLDELAEKVRTVIDG